MDPGFSKDHKFSMDRKFAAYCPCRSSSCVMIVNFCCPDHVHHVQEAEDSSKQAEHNTSQASKQPSKEAAAEGAPLVSKDTEMEDAELASKGVEDNDGKHVGGGSKGTKRAAEHEAGAENSAASLTVAPSAKRQKTDADWGELVVIQSLLAVLATCALSCNAARLVHGSPHREASYPSPSGFSCLNAKSPPPPPSSPLPSRSLPLTCLGTQQQVHAGKSSTEGSGYPFLLACRFFDRECAGYLEADDLEEITFMVSDGISRE